MDLGKLITSLIVAKQLAFHLDFIAPLASYLRIY